MTPAVVVQIIGWSVQAISTIAELVKTALEGAEPKTNDQLDAELVAIISSRAADRAKAAAETKAAADKALADAAASEFDEKPKGV